MKKTLFTAVVLASSLAFAADWAQFLGPNRDGKSTETGLAHSFPADGPKILWSVPVHEGFAGAAVFDKKVYFVDRDDPKDAILCLDAATGKELWKYEYDAAEKKIDFPGGRSVPTVTEKYVLAVGPFGQFTCLDRQTHEKLWQTHILKDFGGKLPRWGVGQSPLLYKDTVILAPQSATAGLVAFDVATGKEKWRSEPFGDMAYVSPYMAKVAGVEQIIMLSESTIVGVDLASGKILWKYPPAKGEDGAKPWKPDNPIPAPTDLGDGRFFLTEGYKGGSVMIKVAKNGDAWEVTQLYKTMTVGVQIHRPMFIDGYLYALNNSNDRSDGLECIKPDDGTVIWKTGKSPNFERGNAVCADGVLYIMDGDKGILYIVQPSPEGYKQLAEGKVFDGKRQWGPMAISDGLLFCRDQKQMKCVDIRAADNTNK